MKTEEEKEKIKKEVMGKVNPDFETALERISSNDEWVELHDKYVDELLDITIQKTAEEIFKRIEKLQHSVCMECGSVECATCYKNLEKIKKDLSEK